MGPPPWAVGLTVALGTLFVLVQSPVMASGTVSLILVPTLSIWAGVGASALVSSGASSARQTFLIAGAVIAVFAAHIIELQFEPPPPGASRGGPNVEPPSQERRPTP